jgi:enoyl-CoA hydratase/carnithine racemase
MTAREIEPGGGLAGDGRARGGVGGHVGAPHKTDEILCSIKDRIATITMNRPEKRNAMSTALLTGLRSHIGALDENPDVRVIVIRGAGKAFCSGMDLQEMKARGGEADPEGNVVEVLQTVERSKHPTIAMVQGAAYAGGCELALHCDLRVAADVAKFAMPLAKIGLVVPFVLGQKLVEILGPAYTRQLLFTGDPFDAKRAYEIGMVHDVVPLDRLEERTYALAQSIAQGAPLSLAGIKATIQRAISLRERIDAADLDAAARRARTSDDAKEGVRAMLEKRAPNFRGV